MAERDHLQQTEDEKRLLKKRYRRSRRFKLYCVGALALAIGFLAFFLLDLTLRGYPAFRQAQVRATFTYTEASAEIPKLAVPERLQPFVSRGAMRTISRRMTADPHAEVRVAVDLEEGDPDEPLAAVRPPEAAGDLTAEALRPLLGDGAAEEIAAELQGDHGVAIDRNEPEPGRRWVPAVGSVNQYLARFQAVTDMTDVTGFYPQPQVEGEVTWDAEAPLPAEATLALRLLAFDAPDAEPTVISTEELDRPVPDEAAQEADWPSEVDFALPFDLDQIRLGRRYLIEARAHDARGNLLREAATPVLDGSDLDRLELALTSDAGGTAEVVVDNPPPEQPPFPVAKQKRWRELYLDGLLRRQYNQMIGTRQTRWVAAVSDVDQYLQLPDDLTEEELSRSTSLSDEQRHLMDQLAGEGVIQFGFNRNFFLNGDSRLPEQAGIRSATMGTLLVLLIVWAVSFPIGVLTAIYLEEFAPDNKLTQLIEVNINNLAAVPSILFGLLGLAVFINMTDRLFGVDIRSTALVAGLTLSLMTLPIIIISSRAALRAVPESIRLGAMAMGATRWQTVCHHVLPQSISGILTGTIIGLAQAIGETAPLIIVGLTAFIPDMATGITDQTTVLPAQIFKWSTHAQRGFVELTAAGILVLLAVLLSMNAAAVLLRARFETRW